MPPLPSFPAKAQAIMASMMPPESMKEARDIAYEEILRIIRSISARGGLPPAWNEFMRVVGAAVVTRAAELESGPYVGDEEAEQRESERANSIGRCLAGGLGGPYPDGDERCWLNDVVEQLELQVKALRASCLFGGHLLAARQQDQQQEEAGVAAGCTGASGRQWQQRWLLSPPSLPPRLGPADGGGCGAGV